MSLQAIKSSQLLKKADILVKFTWNQTFMPLHTSSLQYLFATSSKPWRNRPPFANATFVTCCKSARNYSASAASANGSSQSSSSQDRFEESENEEAYSSVDDVREAVLDAALQFVNEFGWTDDALAKGAESLGYSAMAHGLVEGGGAELFCWLQQRLNEQLEERLIHLSKVKRETSAESESSLLEEALRYRLELVLPYEPVYAKGVATVALSPAHATAALRATAQLADHICHYTGRSTPDASWYASRAAIGAVYKATELCLLQDQSPEHQDTWQFLHRRLQELQRCDDACRSLGGLAGNAASVARAAVLTSLNIVGLNRLSR